MGTTILHFDEGYLEVEKPGVYSPDDDDLLVALHGLEYEVEDGDLKNPFGINDLTVTVHAEGTDREALGRAMSALGQALSRNK